MEAGAREKRRGSQRHHNGAAVSNGISEISASSAVTGSCLPLLYCDAFREVTRLVDVPTELDGEMVSKKL